MLDVDFRCTKCGNCCRNLRLPLSVAEAIRWLGDGHCVQVLCEAIPWPGEPVASAHEQAAAYKRARSFAAVSGQLPIRVLVTLAAPLGERCPNLLPDNACRIYERRPVCCRIYPAEANPLLEFSPERRHCPPEAWLPGGSPLTRNSAYVDRELRLQIGHRQHELVDEVPLKRALCAELGIRAAAMANEGYVAHAPEPGTLLRALRRASESPDASDQNWEFISDRAQTVEAVRACDATCYLASERPAGVFQYLSLFGNPGPAQTDR